MTTETLPPETVEAEQEDALKFQQLLERFLDKMNRIPTEYHEILGWLYSYRSLQDQRKRLANRSNQMSTGKRVFWGHVLPEAMMRPMQLTMTAPVESVQKAEDECARHLHRLMRKTSWYVDVAVPAARSTGMSEGSGTLSAAKLLDAFGSASRFETFGQIIKFARLAPDANGRAPKPARGAKVSYSPRAWQALFDLSETWNRKPDSYWRLRWDAWKAYYREKYPEKKTHPDLRVHNMGRRKVLREFLRDLWEHWRAWEGARGDVTAAY